VPQLFSSFVVSLWDPPLGLLRSLGACHFDPTLDRCREVTLILSTSHVSEVFATPIMTFEDTPNCQKTTTLTRLQILNQMEVVEAPSAKPIEYVISQPIVEGQSNLGL